MRTLIAFALFFSLTATAQSTERIEVVEVPGTASELYRNAERWFVDTFKDAQEVIQLRDTANHTLIGKGSSTVLYDGASHMVMRYSMEVGAKPGRYRMRVYDITIQDVAYVDNDSACLATWAGYTPTKYNKARQSVVEAQTEFCSRAQATLDSLVASLKSAMSKPQDDW